MREQNNVAVFIQCGIQLHLPFNVIFQRHLHL